MLCTPRNGSEHCSWVLQYTFGFLGSSKLHVDGARRLRGKKMMRLLLCAWLLGASAKKRKHGKGGIPESTTSLTLLLERDFPSLLSSLSSADAHAPQSLTEQAYAGLKLQSYSVEERSAVLAALVRALDHDEHRSLDRDASQSTGDDAADADAAAVQRRIDRKLPHPPPPAPSPSPPLPPPPASPSPPPYAPNLLIEAVRAQLWNWPARVGEGTAATADLHNDGIVTEADDPEAEAESAADSRAERASEECAGDTWVRTGSTATSSTATSSTATSSTATSSTATGSTATGSTADVRVAVKSAQLTWKPSQRVWRALYCNVKLPLKGVRAAATTSFCLPYPTPPPYTPPVHPYTPPVHPPPTPPPYTPPYPRPYTPPYTAPR